MRGTVSAVEGSGKVKGRASITLHFASVAAAGRDDRYDIDATYSETAEGTKGSDATKIGVGAGAGAAIGGLLGGKSGAAIGGGTGAAVVLGDEGQGGRASRRAILRVRLERDVDVRVPIKCRGSAAACHAVWRCHRDPGAGWPLPERRQQTRLVSATTTDGAGSVVVSVRRLGRSDTAPWPAQAMSLKAQCGGSEKQ